MISRDYSDEDGIILVTATGAWNEHDVDQHYEALRLEIAARRETGLPILLLSDVTQAKRQAPAVERRTMWQIEQTFAPGDRLAVLVTDADDKAHVRGLLGKADMAAFSSKIAAQMWLLYEGLEAPR
ncbi:hypothetical protein KFK14_19475 [Sphingobium phenoxybenzoativorans]|uniref:STAS/SEC14 domain-containing protein n=1 Tax=Sphingobium phenoxybenzoativorans TaxID=1592790 RepID=A0A975Q198_9SPHN|nr:hypothetical protein [Sphingobium phenoxybenzoativorans]QUT05157.1 hypothetical protein KFK14_19475 [Sphingobium phenoxybenzoativorans]